MKKALDIVMLLIYVYLLTYCAVSWATHGGDAWGLATVGWFCAVCFRIIYTLREDYDHD